jgi:hypothetical protein
MNTLKIQKQFDIPADKIWKVVAEEYSTISNSHPTIVDSHFLNGHTEVKEGAERFCAFDDNGKQYLKERIIKFNPEKRTFTNAAYEAGKFPLDTSKTQGTFTVDEIDKNRSKVTFLMEYQTKPAFMGALVKGQFKKLLKDYFVSIEHYARTGESITLENYKEIRRKYSDEAKKIMVA